LVFLEEKMVQALKIIGLGTLISTSTFAVILAVVILRAVRRAATGVPSDGHATGLSVIVFNPIPYLIILASFGLAYWLVRRD
jgi:hypothetical protein